MGRVAEVNGCRNCNKYKDNPDDRDEMGEDERIRRMSGDVGTLRRVKLAELNCGHQWKIAVFIHWQEPLMPSYIAKGLGCSMAFKGNSMGGPHLHHCVECARHHPHH